MLYMIEVQTKLKKWGNSFGLVVPTKLIEKENLSEGNEVTVLVIKKAVNLRQFFGVHKFKKSVEEMMKEGDKELYNDD